MPVLIRPPPIRPPRRILLDEEKQSETPDPPSSPDLPSSPEVLSTTKSNQAEGSRAECPFEDEHCLQEIQLYKHITISRDHTAASAEHQANLLAAFGSQQKEDENVYATVNSTLVNLAFVNSARDNIAYQDYSQQLMLIEQQNKRELLLMAEKANQIHDLDTAGTDYGINEEQGKRNMQAATIQSVKEIQQEIQKLQDLQKKFFSTKCEVFYKIIGDNTTFLAEPSWTSGSRGLQFQGNSPIAREPTYLNQRPEIAFVVYKYYGSTHQAKEIQDSKSAGTALPKPAPCGEAIAVVSEPLATALEMFLNRQGSFKTDFPAWVSTVPIKSPFLFWYYYRSSPVLDLMEEPH